MLGTSCSHCHLEDGEGLAAVAELGGEGASCLRPKPSWSMPVFKDFYINYCRLNTEQFGYWELSTTQNYALMGVALQCTLLLSTAQVVLARRMPHHLLVLNLVHIPLLHWLVVSIFQFAATQFADMMALNVIVKQAEMNMCSGWPPWAGCGAGFWFGIVMKF